MFVLLLRGHAGSEILEHVKQAVCVCVCMCVCVCECMCVRVCECVCEYVSGCVSMVVYRSTDIYTWSWILQRHKFHTQSKHLVKAHTERDSTILLLSHTYQTCTHLPLLVEVI